MKNKSIRSIFLGLFLITSGLLKAQMAVSASGGNATGSNGSSSYSVGQVAYLYKGINDQVMEGVQVAYEITTLAASEVNSSKESGILLYPNPFRDDVYLDFTTNDYKGSDYQLFDAQGKLIKKDKITQTKSEFNFSSLPSAMYIIRINQNGKNITTFKIIKK